MEGSPALSRAPGATMGNSAGRSDFEWVYTDQPHTQRRKEMLGELGTQVGTALGPSGVPGQREPRGRS